MRFIAGKGLGWLWKGVYLSPLGPARLREVSAPPLPPGWAMVRVAQCGLCTSDIHLIRLGFSPRVAPVAAEGADASPVILGHELVGEVQSAGEGCGLSVGQRVVSRSGGFRNCFNLGGELCPRCARGEYAFCHRHGPSPHEPIRGGGYAELYWEHAANLLPVPAGLSNDHAMLAEPLACSLRAALKLEAPSGSRVLVLGAGLQGLAAVHWLKNLRPDLKIACLARHEFQADLAAKLGAASVLKSADPQALADLTETRYSSFGGNGLLQEGFDAVIDAVGTPGTIHQALRWIRPGGLLVVLGAYLAYGRLDYTPIWFREVRVAGVYAHGMEHFEGRDVPTLALTLELLASRAPLPVNLVTHRAPLREFARAMAIPDNKKSTRAVRVAIVPNGTP
jgi:threonine dehydrogenase-like Zn-dependent dehydrogenase